MHEQLQLTLELKSKRWPIKCPHCHVTYDGEPIKVIVDSSSINWKTWVCSICWGYIDEFD